MVVERCHVEGYDAFSQFLTNQLAQLEAKFAGRIFVLFSGSPLPTGESWCSDCREADPLIEEAITQHLQMGGDALWLHVDVGDRPTWKDPNCSFRKDNQTKLMVVPTLIRWGTEQRLEGAHCKNPDLLEMLFTEE